MARTLEVGPVRVGMAIGATAGLIITNRPFAAVTTILAGTIFGLALSREATSSPSVKTDSSAADRGSALIAIGLFAFPLIALPFLAAQFHNTSLGLAGAFYRAGTLVFGGGRVVLPLLKGEVVGRG